MLNNLKRVIPYSIFLLFLFSSFFGIIDPNEIHPEFKTGDGPISMNTDPENFHRGPLEVDGNSVSLTSANDGSYDHIHVQNGGSLTLSGCEITVNGFFFAEGTGTQVSIRDGAKVTITKGNFTVLGRKFELMNSQVEIINDTGGSDGDFSGTGDERFGETGGDAHVNIDVQLPVKIQSSILSCNGQEGGSGAIGTETENMQNGGHGGDGGDGSVAINADGNIEIIDATIDGKGGKGGKGGERYVGLASSRGGNGGDGGNGKVEIKSTQLIKIMNTELNASGGEGGDASRTSGNPLYGNGGDGGKSRFFIDAKNDINFEKSMFFGLGGLKGEGGEENYDGSNGLSDADLRVDTNSIFGRDSIIRSEDIAVENDDLQRETVFLNVTFRGSEYVIYDSLFNPHPVGNTSIKLKYYMSIWVKELNSNRPIPDTDVTVFLLPQTQDGDVIQQATIRTDENGYCFFDEGFMGKTLESFGSKVWSYKVKISIQSFEESISFPLRENIEKTITMEILKIEITEINYRSILLLDQFAISVPLTESTIKVGGIVTINGTAQTASQDANLIGVRVERLGEGPINVIDVSDPGDVPWSKWSYVFQTVEKKGTSQPEIIQLFNDETIELIFIAYDGYFETSANITIEVDQDLINNPPVVSFTSPKPDTLAENNYYENLPDGSGEVSVSGKFFDPDGDNITRIQVIANKNDDPSWTIDHGEIDITSDVSVNLDQEKKEWRFVWAFGKNPSLFSSGSYNLTVFCWDGELSNRQVAGYIAVKVELSFQHLHPPPPPGINNITLIYEDGSMKETDRINIEHETIYEGMKLKFYANPPFSPDGVDIVEWVFVIDEKGVGSTEYNQSSGLFTWTVPVLDQNLGAQLYEVSVRVKDSRGFESSEKSACKFTVTHNYGEHPPDLPPDEISGSLYSYCIIGFIVLLTGIVSVIIIAIIIMRKRDHNTKPKQENGAGKMPPERLSTPPQEGQELSFRSMPYDQNPPPPPPPLDGRYY